MDIKDCKIGTRVVCLKDEACNIPMGTLGTIIENNTNFPFVAWDEYFNDSQFDREGYKNVCGMYLHEIEVMDEIPTKETNIGKLSVSLATEDVNSIVKDILKVVLQELYVGIENISKDLDEGEVSNEVSSEVGGDVTPKESLMTEQYVLDKLLDQINIAINMSDYDSAVKLSEAYQCIKSVSISTARKI